jgi:hypothetical protein
MAVLVDEIGAIAAENVEIILRTAEAVAWPKLVEGGWAGLSADPEADVSLRGLQEIARVAGRHPVPTPLLPTLLAGRWFDPAPDRLGAGIAIALAHGDDLAAAYANGSSVLLDATGAAVDRDRVHGYDRFSEVMPLALVDRGASEAALAPGQAAELHAVLAATAVGCADTVLDRSVEWSQTRVQFGRAIKSFQAVRHHMANMHIAREQAWTAAVACANEPDAAATWSRQACELATTAIELGIQVHGGVGFTSEVGLQLFLCHVMQIRDVLGAVP